MELPIVRLLPQQVKAYPDFAVITPATLTVVFSLAPGGPSNVILSELLIDNGYVNEFNN